jgi:hypothetical protein
MKAAEGFAQRFFASQLREVLQGADWVWAGENISLTQLCRPEGVTAREIQIAA